MENDGGEDCGYPEEVVQNSVEEASDMELPEDGGDEIETDSAYSLEWCRRWLGGDYEELQPVACMPSPTEYDDIVRHMNTFNGRDSTLAAEPIQEALVSSSNDVRLPPWGDDAEFFNTIQFPTTAFLESRLLSAEELAAALSADAYDEDFWREVLNDIPFLAASPPSPVPDSENYFGDTEGAESCVSDSSNSSLYVNVGDIAYRPSTSPSTSPGSYRYFGDVSENDDDEEA